MPEQETQVQNADVAAFFDLDNTLLQGSTIYYLARGMLARRVFTASQLWDFAGRQFRWATSGTENMADVTNIFADVQAMLEGRRVDLVMEMGRSIYHERMEDKIWPQTRKIVDDHLRAGDRVYVVTAAGQEMADLIADELNLTGGMGTKSEIVDGFYTGKMVGAPMHGQVKADAISDLARREGLNLEQCFAYSDSANDLPMLKLVGHPTAINPDEKLGQYAGEHDWPTFDFRGRRVAARTAGSVVSAATSVSERLANTVRGSVNNYKDR
jgi:HAD superfamily hydrolase (TIGR01490 family)